VSRWIFGLQPVREVLRARGAEVRQLLVEPGESPRREGLVRLAASLGVPVHDVDRAELDRRARGAIHQGIAAEAPPLRIVDQETLLSELEREEHPLVVLLDGVVDPQNFGAVVRSAVALGAKHVVWPEHGAAPLSPATFRASAGAVEHATFARVRALPELVHALRERGFVVVVLDAQASATLEEVDLRGPVALVVGAEQKGVRPAVRRAASMLAKLPMSGAIDSLNASVASALALYEVGRQRRQATPKTT
jgi:23S rRNA (guanosine2251-2'-O)-methyltransferase